MKVSAPVLGTLLALLLAGTTPASAASPAKCGPNDKLETGLQGQLPQADRATGRAAEGYNCNLDEVGFYASTSFANFDTYENCAYYSDTIGLYSAEGGTVVLDVSDPRNPKQTDYLTAGSTKNAGESLRVNLRRGLLAADRYVLPDVGTGGKADDPDSVHELAVYDVKGDCRHPKLLADVRMPNAVGHEGCFQPDGNVYYMASTATITPIDLRDPTEPKELGPPKDWTIHGCSISDDGRRGYFGDIGAERMLVADTSQVQALKEGAQMQQVGELPTPTNGGQQSTIPVTYAGHPYVIDWSEFVELGHNCAAQPSDDSNFGYAQIVDMADETKPRVVSKMQTEVMFPENCPQVSGDSAFLTTQGLTAGDVFPLVGSRVFLYDTHYCSTDRLHDPTIVACASFGSGIRVYDIRNPLKPVEMAYYNPGSVKSADGTAFIANATVARPVIRSDLGQIWFPDISKGFHVVQFRDGVWPFADRDPCPHRDYYLDQYDLGYDECRQSRRDAVWLPTAKVCRTQPSMRMYFRQPKGQRITGARIFVDGKRVRTLRAGQIPGRIRIRVPRRGRYVVRVVMPTSTGTRIVQHRRYRACVASGPPPSARAVGTRSFAATPPHLLLQRATYYCRLDRAAILAVSQGD